MKELEQILNNNNKNPVLFIGAGFSKRYCLTEDNKTLPNWEELLRIIASQISDKKYYFEQITQDLNPEDKQFYCRVADKLEISFNKAFYNELIIDKEIQKKIEDIYDKDNTQSPMKIYISLLFKNIKLINDKELEKEIKEFKKTFELSAAYITTNYDLLIENIIFNNEVVPIIGDDIYLNEPEYNLYKVHGCVNKPESIVITSQDYEDFRIKNKVLQSKLINQFVNKTIIFLGYSISDVNVKEMISNIFSFLDKDSEVYNKIKNNFILINRKKIESYRIVEHEIEIENSTISVTSIETNDFLNIYKAINTIKINYRMIDIKNLKNFIHEIVLENRGKGLKAYIKEEDLEKLPDESFAFGFGVVNRIAPLEYNDPYLYVVGELPYKGNEIISLFNNPYHSRLSKGTTLVPIFKFISVCIDKKIEVTPSIEKIFDKILRALSDNFLEKKILSDDNFTIEELIQKDMKNVRKNNIVLSNFIKCNYKLEDIRKYVLDFLNNFEVTTEVRRIVVLYDFIQFNGDEILKNHDRTLKTKTHSELKKIIEKYSE